VVGKDAGRAGRMSTLLKNQKSIEKRINKWIKKAECPLCLGADSMLYHHPSLGNFKGEMSVASVLTCKAGHDISVIGFNSPEFFILSLMDEHKRPTVVEQAAS
jgi:hypothetical protein